MMNAVRRLGIVYSVKHIFASNTNAKYPSTKVKITKINMRFTLLLSLTFAQNDLSNQLNTIFDQDGERQEKLSSLHERINNLVDIDETYNEYYKHLTEEKLAFVIERNKEIEEKTQRLREMMQDYLADADDVATSDEL